MPGAIIKAITERVENIMGSGKDGSVLVHVGTDNVEREGTNAIVRKYIQLVRTLKQTLFEQVILSGILPVIRRRGKLYLNCRGWQLTCYSRSYAGKRKLDLWGSFVGMADMYTRGGLHLSGKGQQYLRGKGAAV